MNLHYIKKINISQAYYHNTIRNDLTRLHGSGTMYNVFCQKFHYYIILLTIHDFSKATIREFVLLCTRCMKPYVDFLITASKF